MALAALAEIAGGECMHAAMRLLYSDRGPTRLHSTIQRVGVGKQAPGAPLPAQVDEEDFAFRSELTQMGFPPHKATTSDYYHIWTYVLQLDPDGIPAPQGNY